MLEAPQSDVLCEGERVDFVVLAEEDARLPEVSDVVRAIESGGACLESSEVDNAVNLRMSSEDLIEFILVGEVDLVECRSLATYEFNAVESNLGRVVEIIYDDDFVAMFEQS